MQNFTVSEISDNNHSTEEDQRLKIAIISVCSGIIIILIAILIVILISKKIKTIGGGLSTYNETVIKTEISRIETKKQMQSKHILSRKINQVGEDPKKELKNNNFFQNTEKPFSIISKRMNTNNNHIESPEEISNQNSKNNFIKSDKDLILKLNSNNLNTPVTKISKNSELNHIIDIKDEISFKQLEIKNSKVEINNKIVSKGIHNIESFNKLPRSNTNLFFFLRKK